MMGHPYLRPLWGRSRRPWWERLRGWLVAAMFVFLLIFGASDWWARMSCHRPPCQDITQSEIVDCGATESVVFSARNQQEHRDEADAG